MPQNQIFTGMGNFSLVAAGTIPRLLNVEPMEFELAGDAEAVNSTKWVNGVLQNAGSGRSSETWTLTIGVEAINWTVLQLALGEFAGITESFNQPVMKYSTIPATPFEIADEDIGTNDTVYVVEVSTGRAFTKVANAAAVANPYEFAVTTGSGSKLTFNDSDTGIEIGYRILKTLADVQTIGVEEVFSTIGNLQFDGVGYGDVDNVHIQIPQMSAAGLPTISFSEVTKLDLEYTLSIATGQRRPFIVAQIPK